MTLAQHDFGTTWLWHNMTLAQHDFGTTWYNFLAQHDWIDNSSSRATKRAYHCFECSNFSVHTEYGFTWYIPRYIRHIRYLKRWYTVFEGDVRFWPTLLLSFEPLSTIVDTSVASAVWSFGPISAAVCRNYVRAWLLLLLFDPLAQYPQLLVANMSVFDCCFCRLILWPNIRSCLSQICPCLTVASVIGSSGQQSAAACRNYVRAWLLLLLFNPLAKDLLLLVTTTSVLDCCFFCLILWPNIRSCLSQIRPCLTVASVVWASVNNAQVLVA